MSSQAKKDTAAAKAKQGGGQAAKDTAAAKAKQNNSNQAAKDTARAKSRQNGGDGGTSGDFAAREAANGLSNTTSGRVASKATNPDFPPVGTPAGNDEFAATSNISGGGGGGFNGSVLICINGEPYYIDIPYDESIGAYPGADGANFTINIGPPE
jgi:hypothetical protein